MSYVAVHDPEKCRHCGVCSEIVDCPGADELICIGCGACVLSCPHQALQLVEESRARRIAIEVNGELCFVPERISVREALREAGYPIATSPHEPGLFAPCEVGGCGSCAVQVNGVVRLACRTIAQDGMRITTDLPKEHVPRRIIMNFSAHPAGGVGTPWQTRNQGTFFLEVVCFAAGCNLRCPQCQNWLIAYRGRGQALTPGQAARNLTLERRQFNLNRMTISGGESTLNRPWLVQFLRELKRLNPDPEARFHVDTNGSLLSHDYVDELVAAGMTDIGIDLKALDTDTFLRITGLSDSALAEKYKETAWEAVSYLVAEYSGRVFTGVGIPYNRDLVSQSEISRMGQRIAGIDPSLQVTVLNYRPEFRSRIVVPGNAEMAEVRQVLQDTGLTTVLAQTGGANIGP
ncbi:MAG: radical SAM protein [Chloroflexota bacterium]|nr:radical SAM protein [Chloroflexota bacterium]